MNKIRSYHLHTRWFSSTQTDCKRMPFMVNEFDTGKRPWYIPAEA